MWANWQPTKIKWNGKPRDLPKGSVVIGIREIADHLGFSKDTVYRQLQYLSERDTISYETSTRGTIVTILNYEQYQDDFEILRQSEGHGCDTPKDTSRTPAERQPTLNEEYNNIRNNTGAEISEKTEFDFEHVYSAYPRRDGSQGKKQGFEKLAKKIKTPEEYGTLLAAVRNYHGYCDRLKLTGTEKVKQFITFVNSDWSEWSNNSNAQKVQKIQTYEDLFGDQRGVA
jgi:hypothetical protein